MKKYCDQCKKEVEAYSKKIIEEYDVFNDKIKVRTEVLRCPICDNNLFDEALDEKTLRKVYDIYKKKNHLLSSKEIINIRNKYGLSQRGLAKLLGWGDKTIFRYEKGSIQDSTHNYILEKLKDEKNMLSYINENKDRVDHKIIKTILSNIDQKKNINFDYAD